MFQNLIFQHNLINEKIQYNLNLQKKSEKMFGGQKYVQRYVKKLLPSKNDEFHDGSGEQFQINQLRDINRYEKKSRETSSSQHTRSKKHQKINKKIQKKNKKQIIIQIQSDSNEEPKEQIIEIKDDNISEQIINFNFNDLDEEELQYLKIKLQVSTPYTSSQNEDQKILKPKFVPPPDVILVPKRIHEYPPYPLGPNDVWPPKYPNSWRQFKRDMRDTRKLD